MGQDGRVEGLKFTFSHENTNITTNYRTTISKIDREPTTKKDILPPKTKKKLHQDGRIKNKTKKPQEGVPTVVQ